MQKGVAVMRKYTKSNHFHASYYEVVLVIPLDPLTQSVTFKSVWKAIIRKFI